ncbi:rhodanese-like domain-containing protein [Hoyosella sp. YIM 151337]|uniref:rhodanese-like domain-containing protein n=1 Tax=Hoyosella sp. YIM 151337 TaxID=2992742 RepID=UPI002236BDF1|nr:rhodanese-like domain-containing protein [Hoyosella sp. YIM 151337]MCW4351842.1 rhodanese-like domain-containing protein [Hoyosella sp. YIM 151337]
MSYAGDLTPEQAWELLRDNPQAVLVDVRTQAEWNYVGVPDISSLGKRTVLVEWLKFPSGARNADFLHELTAAGITPEQPIVFICRSGQRSIGSAQLATSAGLGPSYNMLDGFEGALDEDGHRGKAGWRALGFPWRQS